MGGCQEGEGFNRVEDAVSGPVYLPNAAPESPHPTRMSQPPVPPTHPQPLRLQRASHPPTTHPRCPSRPAQSRWGAPWAAGRRRGRAPPRRGSCPRAPEGRQAGGRGKGNASVRHAFMWTVGVKLAMLPTRNLHGRCTALQPRATQAVLSNAQHRRFTSTTFGTIHSPCVAHRGGVREAAKVVGLLQAVLGHPGDAAVGSGQKGGQKCVGGK